MPANYEVFTFDCYGTLIDWEGGIANAFADVARAERVALDAERALIDYHHIEPQVEAEQFRLYHAVLAETARRAVALQGWQMSEAVAQRFADSLPQWTPFPDTNGALERLAKAGYRLGILSNVDTALLQATLRHFTVPMDFIVTAQQVGSYKPAHAHFKRARTLIGDQPWLHAAQSHFHDVVPATALGIPVVWVNRKQEALPAGGPAPLAQVPTLAALADWLGA